MGTLPDVWERHGGEAPSLRLDLWFYPCEKGI
jgi:hypothetical protein